MAAKKKRKKASKAGKAWHKAMMAAKAAKHGKKRAKKTATRSPKASGEISLLQKIDRKVTRIDQTVNAGFHLARKAKRHSREAALSQAFEEAQRSGELAE